jgi:cell division transport system ATP-binding protein
MIRLTRAEKRYGDQIALAEVTWEVGQGEFVVLLGPSGAGKTTLLRLFTLEETPTAGTVQVGGIVSGRVSRAERSQLRRTLGVVFEDFKLLDDRNLFENVALALRIQGVWDRETLFRRVEEILARVGLPGRGHAYPKELSAGQKQRVAIARAIVNRPLVVLADEPTGNLDPRAAEDVLELLFETHRAGTAIVLVTNDGRLADDLHARGARLTELRGGRIVRDEPSRAPAATADLLS